MDLPRFPAPTDGFLITHTLIVNDVRCSLDWYRTMLDGEVVMEPTTDGVPAIIKVANGWIIINFGGGDPTDDKPDTEVRVKADHEVLSSFLNIRVADIEAFYRERFARGAQFVTEPIDRGAEIRCYMRDPDGYLIEVGQAKV